MSTSVSAGAQDLTEEEQILHHYAAVVKRDLETYRAFPTSMSQKDWEDLFKDHLVRFILAIRFFMPFSDLSRAKRCAFMPTPSKVVQKLPFVFMRCY
jgi:hypothetical protein